MTGTGTADIVGTEPDETDNTIRLAAHLGGLLQQRGWSITTAESCTGGLIGAAVTAVAGSSGWFEQGFITYSNAAKHRQLDVPTDVIDQYGAVSEEVVAAMARGARSAASAQVGVAVSGVAGPGGGSANKPVGTVCIAWDIAGCGGRTTRCQFAGNREAVRHATVVSALRGTIRLLENPENSPS